jgi:hypothetical protein
MGNMPSRLQAVVVAVALLRSPVAVLSSIVVLWAEGAKLDGRHRDFDYS